MLQRFAAVLLLCSVSLPLYGQTTTTYTYDVHGRVVSSSSNSGASSLFEYDKAGNITRAKGVAVQGRVAQSPTIVGANRPPLCGAVHRGVQLFSPVRISGTLNCYDPDGNTLQVVNAVTSGTATVSIASGDIIISNIPAGETVVTRTVTDGQGWFVTSTINVSRDEFVCNETLLPLVGLTTCEELWLLLANGGF